MTQIIGELSIADPINLVIGPVVSFRLAVSTPAPVAFAITPPAAQVIVTAGQGPGGPQGVAGPAGPRGLPGASSVPAELLVSAIGGAQVIVLPSNLVAVSGLFINGLRQGLSNYTLSGTNLTLPSDTVSGDAVSILYFTP